MKYFTDRKLPFCGEMKFVLEIIRARIIESEAHWDIFAYTLMCFLRESRRARTLNSYNLHFIFIEIYSTSLYCSSQKKRMRIDAMYTYIQSAKNPEQGDRVEPKKRKRKNLTRETAGQKLFIRSA